MMRRSSGNLITFNLPAWSTSSTSGVFNLSDVGFLKAANTWPRGPVAPTNLFAAVNPEQLPLTWTAPATTYGTITNYLVEYTPSGGATSTVLTGSTSTSYTLTGLTNGVSYTIRVAAVNNFTTGDFSSAVNRSPSPFSPMAVVLTTGSSYTVPNGATSMKAYAIGGGGKRADYCDSGSGSTGGNGATAIRTYSVTGGQTVSYSIGAGTPDNLSQNCDAFNVFAGSTTVTYGGVSVVASGGRTHRDGPPINGTCTNSEICGVAGNDVSGINAAVTLAGGSIAGRGINGDYYSGGSGAVVLYFVP
jgi:cellulose 1,4-beta-cellobiosidase